MSELDAVVLLVRLVGAMVLDERAQGLTVREKTPGDPVSSADELANEMLVSGLAKIFPGTPVVAEESDSSVVPWPDSGLMIFVDPIDGTRDFVSGGDDFAVMVGGVVDGTPVWGVVYEPAKDLCVVGGPDGVLLSQGARAVTLSAPPSKPLDQSTLVVSRTRSGGRARTLLESLGAKHILPIGGMGTKLMLVATGGADAYVQPFGGGYGWDTAAGEAILRRLGMNLTDAGGGKLSYKREYNERRMGLIAARPELHSLLRDRLAKAVQLMAADGLFTDWPRRTS